MDVQLESLWVEMEALGKQIVPLIEGEKKVSDLVSEIEKFLREERGKQTRLEGKLSPCPAPHTFSVRSPQPLCE